jgi:hypothetical protein
VEAEVSFAIEVHSVIVCEVKLGEILIFLARLHCSIKCGRKSFSTKAAVKKKKPSQGAEMAC